MAKSSRSQRKPPGRETSVKRGVAGNRITGFIDEADAIQFRKAIKSYAKEVTASKTKAIKALKASGYLTEAGTVSKRYQ